MKNNSKSLFLALLTILFWTTVSTAFKIGLQHLDFIRLLQWSINTSLIIFLLLAFIKGKAHLLFTLKTKDALYSLALGFLNPYLYYILLFNGYSRLPAQVAQPVNMIWPIVMVFLSVPILKHSISYKSYIALIISFAGIVLIASQGSLSIFRNTSPVGLVFALISSLAWALTWLLNTRDKQEPEIKLILNFTSAALLINITSFLFPSKNALHLNYILPAVYIGLFEMGISFFLWMKAMSFATTTDRIGNLVYITPFLSLIFIHFILGEHIHLTTLSGLLLIVMGITFQNYKNKLAH
jgi:drug/metabolite transporter (DMT)-like permease